MNRGALLQWLSVAMLLTSLTRGHGAGIVFQDGFESGALGPAWSVRTSNDGRCTVTTNYAPAEGKWHLVLDDSVNDAMYSAASAAFKLDLTNRKNVVLHFKAKSLGNEFDYPHLSGTDEFDGVSLSVDGGETWNEIQYFDQLGTEWQSFSIDLDWRLPWPIDSWGDNFLVRFSEYDNAPAPIDGIAIDDILVTADDYQHGMLELPASLREGSGPYTGYVLLAYAPTSTVSVTLSASPSDQLALPASVEIPAGQTYAGFEFSVRDDDLANLNRSVWVRGTAQEVVLFQTATLIVDDDAPKGTLQLPSRLLEGERNIEAKLVLDRPATVPLELRLESDPYGKVFLQSPQTLVIPSGSTEAVMQLFTADDNEIQGDLPLKVMLLSSKIDAISTNAIFVDDEIATLSLQIPQSLDEGMSTNAAVLLSGTVKTNLTVTLTSSDGVSAKLPQVVEIPAMRNRVEFPIMAPDNTLQDGTRHVQISVSAPGFIGTNTVLSILDNDLMGYLVEVPRDLVDPGVPVSISVRGFDVQGNMIAGAIGEVDLYVVMPSGQMQALIPRSIYISGPDGWSGAVRLPAVTGTPLQIRAIDKAGRSGDSIAFGTIRIVELSAADLVWDHVRNRLYATLRDNAPTNGNSVVAINPDTGEIIARTALSQDPGQLALTSGGEFLYVSLNANGHICRINPISMTIESTFAVGTDPLSGTLFAADMCAMEDQPRSLVVSRRRKSGYVRHAGVAVYDDGVPRPVTTPAGIGSSVIEASSDPAIFFGYNTEDTSYGLRKLRVDTSGIREVELNTDLINGEMDLVAQGDFVFTSTGLEVDAMQMKNLGAFPVGGLVRPDLTNRRVHFLLRDPYYYWAPFSIQAFDTSTFSLIRAVSAPGMGESYAASFIRWGTNGLAFRTETRIAFLNLPQLIPTEPTADLRLNVTAAPDPVLVSNTVTYTLTVSNQGPAVAKWVHVPALLSQGQRVRYAQTTVGSVSWSNELVSLDVAQLAAGTSATLQVTAVPESAGLFTCTASASSMGPDNYLDNHSAATVRALYAAGTDSVNRLRLPANTLLYDPLRRRLWASFSASDAGLPSNAVVSIDPYTGALSEPLSLNASPTPYCMALSDNGRYLYVGLSSTNQMHRFDLSSSPPTSLRISLGGQAMDVETLDGDGTAFLIARWPDSSAVAFDGDVQRGPPAGPGTISQIERTSSLGKFFAYHYPYISSLAVTAQGVTVTSSNQNVLPYSSDVVGSGDLVLSSTGLLVDSTNLTLEADLGWQGRPCLDGPNGRAYIVSGDNVIHAFDTVSFLPTGIFDLPLAEFWDQPTAFIRWGFDGFAILGNSGMVYIVRWSSAIPEEMDSDNDGISDRWELTNFGSLNVELAADADGDGISNGAEYFFATSPTQTTLNPLQITADMGGARTLKLIYPRRAGLSPCQYELSPTLATWTSLANVTETIVSTETVDGVRRELVEATVSIANAERAFIRLSWTP